MLFRSVQIDLIVRGICCLRAGVKGVSDNIRVYSIIGRFLEHSRAFYFANGGQEEIWLGSADWMNRNLRGRVEVVFPVEDEDHKRRIYHDLIELALNDRSKGRQMQADGTYLRRKIREDDPVFGMQEQLMDMANGLSLSEDTPR